MAGACGGGSSSGTGRGRGGGDGMDGCTGRGATADSSPTAAGEDMVAHVGDFGLAKIPVEGSSFFLQSMSSMGFRGTIGYIAPEYGSGNMVSTNGDIYSYEILVLESVTGKRPTDSGFSQGLSLREYVELGLHDRVMDVFGPREWASDCE